MLDVKAWLETTGLSVEYVNYENPPALPWVIYFEDHERYGSDLSNELVTRSFAVELYRKKSDISAETTLETLFDAKALEYTKNTVWLSSERCYMTVYNFSFTERK
ncbi:MAG: hypothetical protein FD179_1008 [Erysipelotrichaceae bacterium]|nr:MAG: hypothetical protein FD179_1008 [Erysipelotrichaceae bacterium]